MRDPNDPNDYRNTPDYKAASLKVALRVSDRAPARRAPAPTADDQMRTMVDALTGHIFDSVAKRMPAPPPAPRPAAEIAAARQLDSRASAAMYGRKR